MNEIKSIIIIAYYLVVTFSILYFKNKLKSKTGNKVGGSLNFKKIPKHLIWLPVTATICVLLIIIFPFVQLFNNTFYNILLPLNYLNNIVTFIIGFFF